MSDNVKDLLNKIDKTYNMAFGRTPLNRRLDDIRKEASELCRYTDLKSLKEEAGDLITTTLQLINECGWDLEQVVDENLAKIKKRKNQYKSLGRKTQVAVIEGGFNPIIDSDIKLAQLILNQSQLFDEVYFMPSFDNTSELNYIPPEHRLEMCKIATQNDGRMKVSDYKIANKFQGSTYNLADRLIDDKKYKDTHSFSFVISQGIANTFSIWDRFLDLERLVRFVTVKYSGDKHKRGVDWYMKPPHIFIEPDQPIGELSTSFNVRKSLQAFYLGVKAKDIKGPLSDDPTMVFNKCLDKNVKDYILKHKLYK